MSRSKTLVVVTRKLPDAVETRMCELFETRLNTTDAPMSQQDLAERLYVTKGNISGLIDRLVAAGVGCIRR